MHARVHPAARGFTLIELLTVIAIIGILAAIIIPTVGAVRSSAKSAQCLSNIRTLSHAMLGYAVDNKDTLPPPFVSGSPATPWNDKIATYLSGSSNAQISTYFLCPAYDASQQVDSSGANGTSGNNGSFTRTSYSMNNTLPIQSATVNRFTQNQPKSLTKIHSPSNTVMLVESAHNTLAGSGRAMLYTNMVNARYRHGAKKLNAAFVDGSARLVDIPDTDKSQGSDPVWDTLWYGDL